DMRTGWMWGTAVLILAHGSIAPVAAQSPTPTPTPTDRDKPSVRREPGRTTFEFSEGSLSISNRMQFRWTQEMPEETLGGGGGGGLVPSAPAVGDRGSFRIRRAKTELTGFIWDKSLT